MTTPLFVEREFPSRIANLGFFVALPQNWQPLELPDEEPDFSDARKLFGLAAAHAPYAALVFTAAARPAFDDGTVQDWARWLIEQHGVDLRTLGPGQLGSLPAILGQCAPESDMGPMQTHFAFAEDGGRLIHLSLTGPEELQAQTWQAWQQVLRSFRLAAPQGPSVPLAPAPAVHQAPADAPVADVGQFALPGGLATLQQDHPLQQAWLSQGQGFAPPIRAADEAGGRAWVASMALQAVLALPTGWHALDDSRRLLLLHPDNSVQISLQRLAAPEGLAALLDQIEAQTRADYPAPQFLRLQCGPVQGLAVRGIADGDQALEQMHLLLPAEEGFAVRARVTATPAAASQAGDLAEALLHSLQFVSELAEPETPVHDERPEWARQAEALEAQGRLAEAERLMLDSCPYLGVLISVAEMYRREMGRCLARGEAAAAASAREAAVRWAHAYAASATSGGEGVALSRERDEFLARLG
ncbi:hypothetical protein [Inhella sp.]|uniref:hypothetical protein n=1 Tax=Inhella sp. TaxID=1921806 RepID=UPI0035B47BEA